MGSQMNSRSMPAVAARAVRISHHGHQRWALSGRGLGKTAQNPKAPAGMVAESDHARPTSALSGTGRSRRTYAVSGGNRAGDPVAHHVQADLREQQRAPAGAAVSRPGEEQDAGERQVGTEPIVSASRRRPSWPRQ